MPIYEYACSCGARFEVARPVAERDDHTDCVNFVPEKRGPPEAKVEHLVRRVVSKTSFQLNGTGWYKDGYK